MDKSNVNISQIASKLLSPKYAINTETNSILFVFRMPFDIFKRYSGEGQGGKGERKSFILCMWYLILFLK
jgi:hypothetical protein